MQNYTKHLDTADITTRPILDDISIVIPTLGRAVLETCLYYIAHGSTWPARIILVDQATNPNVEIWLQILERTGLSTCHVHSTQRSRAAGVNRGLEQVDTRFVAITDDDCFVDTYWLQNMVKRLRNVPHCIVTGRVDPEGEERVVALMPSHKPMTHRRPHLKHDSMSGGNMGVANEVLKLVGPLDEDPCLRAAEDCEYSYRALRSGVHIIYDPEVSVRHLGWRSLDERATQYHTYARSHGGFYGKYLRRGDWFIAMRVIIHLLRAWRRWLAGTLTGDHESAIRGAAYLRGITEGIWTGWQSEVSIDHRTP